MKTFSTKKVFLFLTMLASFSMAWQDAAAIEIPVFNKAIISQIGQFIKEHKIELILACATAPLFYLNWKMAKNSMRAKYVEINGQKTLVYLVDENIVNGLRSESVVINGVQKLIYFVDNTIVGELPRDAVVMINDEDGTVSQSKKVLAHGWMGNIIAAQKPLRKTLTTLGIMIGLYRLLCDKSIHSLAGYHTTLMALGK